METNSAPDLSSDDDSDDEVPDPDSCQSIKENRISRPNLPLTQKRKCVPYYGVHRDKESLLEEVQALQEAFQDQKFHLRVHKEYHNAMQAESRRLESQIEFLETSGLEAPRTGTRTKLKSKLKGCRSRLLELETTCASNTETERKLHLDTQFMRTQVEDASNIFRSVVSLGSTYSCEEITLDHEDLVMRCQEATVQRDMFALEVRRLQRFLFHLKNLYKKVCDDNKQAIHLKEEIAKLLAKVQPLETSVSVKRKSLEDMAVESLEWTAKGAAANTACASDNSRFKSLQDESKVMMDLLFTEKLAKANFTTMVNTLEHEVRLAEKESREKNRDALETA